MERRVVNASPLICLTKVGFSDFLLKLPNEIIGPNAVKEEIQAGRSGDPARAELASGKFPMTEISADPAILSWDLGKGETAVLSYALSNPGWEVSWVTYRQVLTSSETYLSAAGPVRVE